MYFLPSLCDIAKAQGELGYVRMMERDILQIIDLVAPDDGSGAANVKVVRKVLQQLQQKAFLQPQTVTELEECITGRDSMNVGISSPVGGIALEGDGKHGSVRQTPQSVSKDASSLQHTGIRLDKRQIEVRIEEDRERHKRARENIWAIPQTSGSNLAHDAEFHKMWAEVSGPDDDDYQIAKEEAEERRRHLEYDE